MIDKLKAIRKENSLYRLGITGVNLVILVLFCVLHYFTGTQGFRRSAVLLEEVIKRENSSPFKDLQFRDECLSGEKDLMLYAWPGTMEGCICKTKPGLVTGNLNQYFKYLDKTCYRKTITCIETTQVNSTRTIPIYRTVAGKKLCYTNYEKDEIVSGMNYSYIDGKAVGPYEFVLYDRCSGGFMVKQGLPCPVSSVSIKDEQLLVERVGPQKKPFLIDIEYSLNSPRCFRSYTQPERNMPQGENDDYPFIYKSNTGCSDQLDNDYATILGYYLEKELYQSNGVYTGMTASLYLYDHFVAQPGNLMNLYGYHAFGFMFVGFSDIGQVSRN